MDYRLIRTDGWEYFGLKLTFDMPIVFITMPLTLINAAAKCRDLVSDNFPTLIVDISNQATVGITATLSCHGLNHTLIGPNTTTCMGNGEWDPDPTEAKCKGHPNRPLHTCIYIEKHETIPYSQKFSCEEIFFAFFGQNFMNKIDFYPVKFLSRDNDCI